MTIELTWTSLSVPSSDSLSGRSVVVVDALRATSTIATALDNGAAGIIPIATVEEARACYADLPGALLSGERGSLKMEGFDLGNSPLEYTPEVVAGKTIVMTTTNGTHALSVSHGANEIICGSLLNASAVARHLVDSGCSRLLVVCAGTHGAFSLDDAVAAGAIIDRLVTLDSSEHSFDDAATAALILFRSVVDDIPSAFIRSLHGRRLLELGLGDDVRYCASVDILDIVPVLTGSSIAPATTPVVIRP